MTTLETLIKLGIAKGLGASCYIPFYQVNLLNEM